MRCVESGGPEPGVGCAGRGVLTALQILKDLKAFDTYGVDVVVYDILGDVVCGGFAQPIREGFAQEIYLLCSGSFMSLYAANNIAKGIRRLARRGETGLAGVICNSSGDEAFEKSMLAEFAEMLGSRLIAFDPAQPASSRPARWRARRCSSTRRIGGGGRVPRAGAAGAGQRLAGDPHAHRGGGGAGGALPAAPEPCAHARQPTLKGSTSGRAHCKL